VAHLRYQRGKMFCFLRRSPWMSRFKAVYEVKTMLAPPARTCSARFANQRWARLLQSSVSGGSEGLKGDQDATRSIAIPVRD
jgi:hypothetical protein